MSHTRHFTYVLRCKGGRLYTGYTTDPERRLAQHLEGKGARFTRAFPPESMVACLEYPTRKEAMHMEAELKKMDKASKERWLASLA